jgi:hypothetical protein
MAKDNIEMKQSFPNDDLLKEQREMANKILTEDKEAQIVIWPESGPDGLLIFLSISNVTLSLPEFQFYALTKHLQIASKKLLRID